MIEGIALAAWAFQRYGWSVALWYWGATSAASWLLCGLFTRGRNDEFEALVHEAEEAGREENGFCMSRSTFDEERPPPPAPVVRRSDSGGSLEVLTEVPRCDVNPWVNATWRVTASERLKMSVLAPWLVPARLAIICIGILNAVIFANLATLGWEGRPAVGARSESRNVVWRPAVLERALRNFRRVRRRRTGAESAALVEPPSFALPDTVPLPLWRTIVGLPVTLSVMSLLVGVGFWGIAVKGRENITRKARVVVCNHVSMIEPVLLLLTTRATPVTSSDFAALPGLGPVGRLYQLLWLNRGKVDSRQAVVEAMRSRCASDSGFPPVLVFPEGTTLNGRALISFKNGAFTPGAPVQPCMARFPFKVRCGLGLDCSWTTAGPQFLELCIRMMMQPWNRLELTFLPAYFPSQAERDDASLFASNVRTVMSQAMQVPKTEHSWADMWLNMTAKDLGEPPHKTLVSLQTLKTLLGGRAYEREKAKRALERFATADREKDGTLTLDQFRHALRAGTQHKNTPSTLLDTDATDALFRLLSRGDEEKGVDFFSFLVAFALLDADDDDADQALRLVFALLDVANEGVVRESRVCAAFESKSARDSSEEQNTELIDDDAFVKAAHPDDDAFLTEDDFLKFVRAYRRDIRQNLLDQAHARDSSTQRHPAPNAP